jgi:hypothetical protein
VTDTSGNAGAGEAPAPTSGAAAPVAPSLAPERATSSAAPAFGAAAPPNAGSSARPATDATGKGAPGASTAPVPTAPGSTADIAVPESTASSGANPLFVVSAVLLLVGLGLFFLRRSARHFADG